MEALWVALREQLISNSLISRLKGITPVQLDGLRAPVLHPWSMADVVEVVNLGTALDATFFHVKRSANSKADSLAKDGVSRTSLWIDQS